MNAGTAAFTPDLIEQIARRSAELTVELLRGEDVGPELIDAAEVARRFNVSRDFVYEHASELGAIPLGEAGEGRRPRLRFNPVAVADRLGARPHPITKPTRTKPRQRRADVELLPIKGGRT